MLTANYTYSIENIQSITQTPTNCGSFFTLNGTFRSIKDGQPSICNATITMRTHIDSSGKVGFLLDVIKQLCTPIVTKPHGCPPDRLLCSYQNDIVDDEGNYLKTLCLIETAHTTYAETALTCQSNNMQLFVINSLGVQQQLQQKISSRVTTGFLWINGVNENNTWFTYAPDKAPASSDIVWAKQGKGNGSCMMFSLAPGAFLPMGYDCSTIAWPICEFQRDFTSPPDTSWCAGTDDFHDVNGNYEKSLCFMEGANGGNYFQGESNCISHNMQLFDIDSSTIQAQFLAAFNKYSSGSVGPFAWINGRIINNTWYTFDPNREPVFKGLTWYSGPPYNVKSPGNCLGITPRGATSFQCGTGEWIFCEFNKNLMTKTTPGLITQPSITGPTFIPPLPMNEELIADLANNLNQTNFTS